MGAPSLKVGCNSLENQVNSGVIMLQNDKYSSSNSFIKMTFMFLVNDLRILRMSPGAAGMGKRLWSKIDLGAVDIE